MTTVTTFDADPAERLAQRALDAGLYLSDTQAPQKDSSYVRCTAPRLASGG